MAKKKKETTVEVHFYAPGLKQMFEAELKRRAKWRGKRGEPYRKLLLYQETGDKVVH